MGTLGYYLREARKRPLSFLARRARDAALRRLRGARAALGGRPYSARLADAGGIRRGRLFDPESLDLALAEVAEHDPAELADLVRRADAALAGEFTIYSRRAATGDEVDWQRDHHAGCSWPLRFHTRYRYTDLIDLGRPSDVKVPWELSRLQCLPALALAYRWTRREEYWRAARALLGAWDRANPVGLGVNWTVGMEVALRAISVILMAEYLHATPAAREIASPSLSRLLAEHGRFLYRNLEYSDVNGNHYTACLLGLLYLGVYLPGETEAASWRTTALAALREEVLAQTYADGVCHEGSIPYHRLVLEMLLHAALVCRREDLDLGSEGLARIEKMIEFVAAYSKPTGEAPVWGDADDGRVHMLGGQAVNDHRYLLALGAALFGRPDLLARAGPLRLDAAALLDRELLARLRDPESAAAGAVEPASVAFPEGGFFVLRRVANYALVDCGDVGHRGRGGHGHNDALSVELALEGRDVLTDTGCASYSRSVAAREAVISARAHNAAVVDGREPAPISRAEGVRLPHATRCPVKVVDWDPAAGRFRGRHLGYASGAEPVVYERELRFDLDRSALTILDSLDGSGTRTVVWYFHLAEGWHDVALRDDGVALMDDDGETRVRIRGRPAGAEYSLIRTPVYPSYDLRRERWCMVMTVEAKLPVRAEVEISWVGPATPAPEGRRVEPS